MDLFTKQFQFAQSSGSVASLAVTLPQPTTIGNVLSLYLRFSPLTGTPSIADNFGNKYRRTGITNLSTTLSVGLFTAEIVRGGAAHTVTAAAQGGNQTLECGVTELSVLSPDCNRHERHTAEDLLFGLWAQAAQQTDYLRRITTALRG